MTEVILAYIAVITIIGVGGGIATKVIKARTAKERFEETNRELAKLEEGDGWNVQTYEIRADEVGGFPDDE